MIRVHVTHHKDQGDHLLLTEAPWWIVAVESAVGSYHPRFGWDYRIWNRILIATDKKHRDLFNLKVEDFCEISVALWGSEHHMCWKTECVFTQGDP